MYSAQFSESASLNQEGSGVVELNSGGKDVSFFSSCCNVFCKRIKMSNKGDQFRNVRTDAVALFVVGDIPAHSVDKGHASSVAERDL